MQKIYNLFARYLDDNRQANRDLRSSWRRRLQDIYIAHHRQQETDTDGHGKTPDHHVKKE